MNGKNAVALSLLLLPARAFAAFEDLGAGARAPGMGNAFTSLADDASAIYYNPAGLAQLERSELVASYSRMYMGLSDGSNLGNSQFAYAHPLRLGRWGTFGTSYNRMALSGLYSESSLYLSYGRSILRTRKGSNLMAGLNAKYLTRGFSQLPEAFNACNGLTCAGGTDPSLTGKNSKSAIGADAGFLYRFPRRFQLGAMIENANRPDVGFAGTDKLPMNLRLSGAYTSLWMTLAGELQMDQAPSGARDKNLIVAAERFFPTLDYGAFGLRGSVGAGSRDFKQFTIGMSYRINKIQADYGFILPIGAIQDTAGSHRVSLSFFFGAPTVEQEMAKELLEQVYQVRSGKGTSYGTEYLESLRPHPLTDPQFAAVRREIAAGRFRQAHYELTQLIGDETPDPSLVWLSNRLALVALYYPELTDPSRQWEIVLSSGINGFLYTRDHASVLLLSYAASMNPTDTKLSNFLTKVEEGTGAKAIRIPLDSPRSFMQELLYRVELAFSRGEQEKVLSLLNDVLIVDPTNMTATERVGSAYYALGRYKEAVRAWENALKLEPEPHERATIMAYLSDARKKIGMPPLPGAPALGVRVSTGAALTEPEQPPEEAPAPARRHKALGERVLSGDPREIPQLYQRGVEHYARGEYLQATAMFTRILDIDPNNAQAKKALERIRMMSPKDK